MMYPSPPYTPFQLPLVTVSVLTKTADGGGGGPFDTLTVIPAEVEVWPWVSLAIAVKVCEPFAAVVVSHGVEKEGPEPETAAPRFAPSNWNCTDASPIAEDALAVTVTV